MNDRTKQPVGMRTSEKYVPVFRLQSLSSRCREQLKWVHLFLILIAITIVSRVLLLTLISFPKNAAKRADGECLAEVLFLKENKVDFTISSAVRIVFLGLCFPLLFFIFKYEQATCCEKWTRKITLQRI